MDLVSLRAASGNTGHGSPGRPRTTSRHRNGALRPTRCGIRRPAPQSAHCMWLHYTALTHAFLSDQGEDLVIVDGVIRVELDVVNGASAKVLASFASQLAAPRPSTAHIPLVTAVNLVLDSSVGKTSSTGMIYSVFGTGYPCVPTLLHMPNVPRMWITSSGRSASRASELLGFVVPHWRSGRDKLQVSRRSATIDDVYYASLSCAGPWCRAGGRVADPAGKPCVEESTNVHQATPEPGASPSGPSQVPV